MGAYAPAPIATPELVEEIHQTVLQPTIDAMRRNEGHPFVGLLFTGFMITKHGPRVLEYNVRFGDPETQTLLPLMDTETGTWFGVVILFRCLLRIKTCTLQRLLDCGETNSAIIHRSCGSNDCLYGGKTRWRSI